MKKYDFQLIGYIGVALGWICMLGGVFTSIYYVESQGLLWWYVVYPYADYTAPLFAIGVVSLVIGLAFLWRAKQEEKEKAVLPKHPD